MSAGVEFVEGYLLEVGIVGNLLVAEATERSTQFEVVDYRLHGSEERLLGDSPAGRS